MRTTFIQRISSLTLGEDPMHTATMSLTQRFADSSRSSRTTLLRAALFSLLCLSLVWAVGSADAATCPCTIWPGSTTPAVAAATNDSGAVELGVKFRANVDGSITGIRFYKGATNTGTHVGSLWSSTGTSPRQRHLHRGDSLWLAASQFRHPGGHHGKHHLRGLLPYQRGQLCLQPELFRRRRDQRPPHRPRQRRGWRERRVPVRGHQRLPRSDLERQQLLGGCGLHDLWRGTRRHPPHRDNLHPPPHGDDPHRPHHRASPPPIPWGSPATS